MRPPVMPEAYDVIRELAGEHYYVLATPPIDEVQNRGESEQVTDWIGHKDIMQSAN